MSWDEIDELIDHWSWNYHLTWKIAGSALQRRQMPVVEVTEDVDYKFQDLLDRRGERWLNSRDNPNAVKVET